MLRGWAPAPALKRPPSCQWSLSARAWFRTGDSRLLRPREVLCASLQQRLCNETQQLSSLRQRTRQQVESTGVASAANLAAESELVCSLGRLSVLRRELVCVPPPPADSTVEGHNESDLVVGMAGVDSVERATAGMPRTQIPYETVHIPANQPVCRTAQGFFFLEEGTELRLYVC